MSRLTGSRSLAGGIISGGKSSRMGEPKDRVMLPDGEAMISVPLKALLTLVDTVYVAGSSIEIDGIEPSRVIFLKDNFPDSGPLGGLEAILACGARNGYIVAACDQPLLTAQLLESLLSGPEDMPCFFETDRIQPFPAYYPAGLLPDIRDAIKRKRLAMKELIADTDAKLIRLSEAEADHIRSANTPQELKSIRHDHNCCH